MAAVERLEEHGCHVVLPPQRGCGYPYIGYGDLKKAKQVALENVRAFAPLVEAGYDVVTTEPTAAYCLKESYPKLLGKSPESVGVAGATFELFEYLELLEGEFQDKSLDGRRFGFHISCHQRPLGRGDHAMSYLRRRGAKVEVVETGTCCGMGGTFGLKKGMLGYELSQAVGEPLFQAFAESGVDEIVTESSVCRIHVAEGTGKRVWHPLELILENSGGVAK
jgi:Fe-S oxidoreductase